MASSESLKYARYAAKRSPRQSNFGKTWASTSLKKSKERKRESQVRTIHQASNLSPRRWISSIAAVFMTEVDSWTIGSRSR